MKVKAKKRGLFLGVLLQWAVTFSAIGQISISPEVGISYFPLEYGATRQRHSSGTTDFFVGVSGMIPVQEQWYINARVSYASRKNLAWRERFGIIPWIMDYRYEHDDLNVDFSINRKLFNRLHLGVGPSIVRKINTVYSMTYTYEDGSQALAFSRRLDRFNYGVSATVGFEFKGLLLKLEYYRQLKDEYQKTFEGSNRYQAVIAYPIRIK